MKHQFATVQHILGALLMLFSTSMLIPLLLALFYGEGGAQTFAASFAITLTAGTLVWLPVRKTRRDLKIRDGFLVVVLFWVVLSSFGALPLLLATTPELTLTDAMFEAVSGLTATGATVLSGLDGMPHAILFWRQLLHWMGGMGIIVLAVAVMPMLGIGGMQLYRAETPGPVKDTKLTPRIRETAKALWYIYLALTLLCVLLFWSAGMSPFDAVSHGFSAIATGGFANYDASIGHFNSQAIELVTIFAMLLGSINFGLHFTAWRHADPSIYVRDPEARAYLVMVVIVSLFVALILLFSATYTQLPQALLAAVFMAISFGTTTGLTVADYVSWPSFIPMFLLLGCFVGGCGGSTTGGMKVVRFLLLAKQGLREINRLVHPNAKIPIKLGGKTVPDRIIQAVWGFFAVYVAVFVIMFLCLLANGVDEVSAFSAVAACINNMGVGLARASTDFAGLPILSKWILSLAMIMGRLEMFTLLVIFTPTFWRQ
ncbi:MAG TPA: TrkH family potassium uptake protein [Salinisphaeraceae bacterium]|nr:TrkH family potassium uptake protein [Salinisphaeraceae bacterium]